MKGLGLAGLLLITVAQVSPGQGTTFPWKSGDPPPAISGVLLGADLATLDRVLGKPSAENFPRAGVVSRLYDQGLSIVHHEGKGVVYILLFTRSAGEIGGLRVGDPVENIATKWGPPHAGKAENTLYAAGDWAVAVQLEQMTEFIHQLALGRTEMFPASDRGVIANIKRVLSDLFRHWESLGILGLETILNFVLWRRSRTPIPAYVHLLAFVSLLTIVGLNLMWIQAGGDITTRRVIIIAIFPMTVYFFFIGMGGLKAAATRGTPDRRP